MPGRLPRGGLVVRLSASAGGAAPDHPLGGGGVSCRRAAVCLGPADSGRTLPGASVQDNALVDRVIETVDQASDHFGDEDADEADDGGAEEDDWQVEVRVELVEFGGDGVGDARPDEQEEDTRQQSTDLGVEDHGHQVAAHGADGESHDGNDHADLEHHDELDEPVVARVEVPQRSDHAEEHDEGSVGRPLEGRFQSSTCFRKGWFLHR